MILRKTKSLLLPAKADSLKHKGADEESHKGTQAQRDKGEGPFCFVPLCLCPCIVVLLRFRKWL
jgi:hypothetical protein